MELYSSFSNAMNFRRSGVDVCDLYKRYALLYDRVIFNRHSCPIGDFPGASDVPEYIANFIVTKRLGDNVELGKNKKFKDIFVDMWDVVENPEKAHEEAMEFVSESDSNSIAKFSWGRDAIDKEMGIYNDRREYKAAAVISADIRSDLGFNFMLNDKFKSFRINLAPVVSDAINSSLGDEPTRELFSTNLIIPNFSYMTWDQILELREDPYIKAFRSKAFTYIRHNEHIDSLMAKDIVTDLWKIAEAHKPNIKKTVIKAVLSNIPLPTIVNPFSLLGAVKEIHENYEHNEKHSWVYFIQNANKNDNN